MISIIIFYFYHVNMIKKYIYDRKNKSEKRVHHRHGWCYIPRQQALTRRYRFH